MWTPNTSTMAQCSVTRKLISYVRRAAARDIPMKGTEPKHTLRGQQRELHDADLAEHGGHLPLLKPDGGELGLTPESVDGCSWALTASANSIQNKTHLPVIEHKKHVLA